MQHCIVAVKLFIRTESITATQHSFQLYFQTCDASSCNTLLLWVSKWCQEGSVKNSKPTGCPRLVYTPDNAEQVRVAMLRSPHRSARQQVLALGFKDSSIWEILHRDLHYYPYKIQGARILVNRIRWTNFSFAILGLEQYLQQCKGWTVTVNAEQYTAMLEIFLWNKLNLHQLNWLWFQQDGAIVHSALIYVALLGEMFPGRLICPFRDIKWTACLLDLSVHYFLWVYIKRKVQETLPANIDDLKQRIRECIRGIPNEILQHFMAPMPSRLQECVEQGSHLKGVIFKQ